MESSTAENSSSQNSHKPAWNILGWIIWGRLQGVWLKAPLLDKIFLSQKVTCSLNTIKSMINHKNPSWITAQVEASGKRWLVWMLVLHSSFPWACMSRGTTSQWVSNAGSTTCDMEETYQAPGLGNSTYASHTWDAAALECTTMHRSHFISTLQQARSWGSQHGLSIPPGNLFTLELFAVYWNRADSSTLSSNFNPLYPQPSQCSPSMNCEFCVHTESEYARWQMEAG